MAKICLNMNYSSIGKLSVATELVKFVENELLPEININPENSGRDLINLSMS